MEQDVDSDTDIVEKEWLGSSSEQLSNNGVDSSLSFVCRRDYMIECNWKVCSMLVSLSIFPYQMSFFWNFNLNFLCSDDNL